MSHSLARLRSAFGDRYVLKREIGSGGMATVYLAEDPKHGREVAIKVLRPDLAANLGAERFLREIRVVARLQHPHILPLHDSGEADGLLYYVMPYVDGPSLRRRLGREGELPVHDATRIIRDVVDALTEAHTQGVVHRDIKPENVLLRGRHALVTDFGVAKAVSEATGRHALTTAGVSLGTPTYMAPEQAAAEPRLDHRVDIYAVGVLAYELLTGRPPIEGASAQQILSGHLTRTPEPVTRHRDTVSPELNALVMRCLEKKPADRWQSTEELLRQIETVMTPSGGVTPTDLRPVGRPVTTLRRWAPAALAAFVLALLPAWWLLARSGTEGPEGEPRALADLRQLTANPLETAVRGAAISPDGAYLAYTDPDGLHVLLMGSGEVRTLDLGGAFTPAEVFWHPDGTRLLFSAEGDGGSLDLWSIPLLGGTPRRLVRNVDWAAVSPDGRRIAYIGGGSGGERGRRQIWLAGADGEDPRLLLETEPHESLWNISWAPDGQRLAFGNWDRRNGTAIETIAVDDGARMTLIRHGSLFQNWTGVLPFTWCGDGRLLFARRDGPGHQVTSNVWAVRTDMATGRTVGEPHRATQLVGSNVRHLSATTDCSSAAALLVRNQADVWMAELDRSGTGIVSERQLTVDQREDYPRSWSADGRSLIFASSRSGRYGIYRKELESGRTEPLHTGAGISRATTAPGDVVLLLSREGVHRLDPDGGAPVLLLEGRFDEIHCREEARPPCVLGSSDGDEYLFRSFDPVDGSSEALARIDHRAPFTNWSLSPDGTTAAVVHNDDNVIRLVELATGRERPLVVEGRSSFEFVDWAPDGEGLFVNSWSGSPGWYPSLLRVDRDGTVHVLRAAANEWHVFPVASPDGLHLAFASMPFHGNAWLLEGF